MDCAYCPNSHWGKRYAFKVDELARTFMELHRRQTVSGLFLSSGIAGDGSKTTERLVKVVDAVRNKYGFKGYIHMKVMPGAEYEYVEAAHRLGTRLSVNIETPTKQHMDKLSAMKDFQKDILDPMRWIHKLTEESTNGAVGQATQLVVGAADETDRDIFGRMDQLYTEWKLKRVYYAPFRPVRYTPLEEHPATPMTRSHRLYQMDWLKRVYKFSNSEIDLAFGADDLLPLDLDPKTSIAVENLDAFPMDVNASTTRVSQDTRCRPQVRAAHRAKQTRPHHRHLERPPDDGRRAQVGLAFPDLPRTPPTQGRAAQARPVRRRRKAATTRPDARARDPDGPLRRGEIMRRMPNVRNARTPRRPQCRTRRHPSATRRVNFTRIPSVTTAVNGMTRAPIRGRSPEGQATGGSVECMNSHAYHSSLRRRPESRGAGGGRLGRPRDFSRLVPNPPPNGGEGFSNTGRGLDGESVGGQCLDSMVKEA